MTSVPLAPRKLESSAYLSRPIDSEKTFWAFSTLVTWTFRVSSTPCPWLVKRSSHPSIRETLRELTSSPRRLFPSRASRSSVSATKKLPSPYQYLYISLLRSRHQPHAPQIRKHTFSFSGCYALNLSLQKIPAQSSSNPLSMRTVMSLQLVRSGTDLVRSVLKP